MSGSHQAASLIWPLMAILPHCRSTPEYHSSLEEILATKLGFAYFYEHCANEFSTENVLCWRAIDSFKKRTSVAAFKGIGKQIDTPPPLATCANVRSFVCCVTVDTFLKPGAYMQVNISALNCAEALETEPEKVTLLLSNPTLFQSHR